MMDVRDYINEMYEAHIQMAKAIKDIAIEYDLTNEQEFINWQDKLNEISQLV